MADFLKMERNGNVVTLIMNRPEDRNAIGSLRDCEEVVEACAAIENDTSVGAVVLTGSGGTFCSGGNLKNMKARKGVGAAATPVETRTNYKRTIQRIPLALYNLEVPTIAAVDGHAIGAGLDLACMCDIRYASTNAKFAESFIKVGIVPGDGGAWLLQRVVGVSRAMEMSFTGDMLDAEEALSVGLVSKVLPSEELVTAAQALAARIAANPPAAMRMTKRLIREAQHTRLDTLLEMSAAFQALAHETEDHREAVDAFLEKRKPAFTGR
jgi:enoyl-CoA hydratase/carnithine racemase